MQPLELHEDPAFDTDLEVDDLRQTQCTRCRGSVAEVHCQQCREDFCGACELRMHRNLGPLAVKDEESKGDGRPHQEHLQPINLCQVCAQHRVEFLCVDCKVLQCEHCCANKHLNMEPNSGHYYFCVQGSSAKKLCYASWSPAFLDLVKTKKRQLQDSTLAATAPQVPTKVEPIGVATPTGALTAPVAPSQAADAPVQVKGESEMLQSKATDTAMGELRDLSITEGSATLASHPPPASRLHQTSAVVDLTLDEDESSSGATQGTTEDMRVKQEPRVKAEDAWLQSATTEASSASLSIEDMLSMGEEEDPMVRSMVAQYNELSRRMYDMEQSISQLYGKMKTLSRLETFDKAEAECARKALNVQRRDLTQATHKRNGVVANLVVCLKPEPQELARFLDKECVADVPHAQTASHKKCAMLEANIRSKLETVQRLQRAMEGAISMKKGDSLAEVTRLGAEIAAAEAEAKALDKERLDELPVLCQFSQGIQRTVREVAGL